MYSLNALEYAIRELYRTEGEGYSEVEEMVKGLNFEALLQAVRDNAQTVHAYTTQGAIPNSFNYRSKELFEGQRATRLYEDFDQSRGEAPVACRTYELWLLEDMSLVAVACVSISYDNDSYVTEYREVKEGELCESGMYLDLRDLTASLLELCQPCYENEQPVYEL